MAASTSDLITQATTNSRPVPTTVISPRAGGVTTLAANALSGWPTGSKIHFCTYKISTSGAKIAGSQIDMTGLVVGTNITSIVIKAGTDNGNAVGDIIEAAPTAAYANDLYSWGTQDHDTQGRHKDLHGTNGGTVHGITDTASAVNNLRTTNALAGANPTLSAEGTDANVGVTIASKGNGPSRFSGVFDAWVTGLPVPNTVTDNGNRNYTCVWNGTDLTGYLSPAMRLRTTRSAVATTQSTLLNGSTQFWSKTTPAGMTFTNFPVVSAWIKLTAYSASQQTIISRYNGTSGWDFQINPSGQVALYGFNAASTNFNGVVSYQAVPLNKWVHVIAQLDMSTATLDATHSYVMIDGNSVLTFKSTGGTNPTALIQAGNLEVGSRNAGTVPFGGKIAQVAVYSAAVTQATISASRNQTLAGTETSLISAYSFNGNANDLNANGNNLTSNGASVATAADAPFGGQANGTISSTLDHGILQSISFSTNTTAVIQMAEGCTIPTSGGVAAVAYSTVKSPYGFPAQREKWIIETIIKVLCTQATPVNNQWYNLTPTSGVSGGQSLALPIGSWNYGYMAAIQSDKATTTSVDVWSTLSTANNTESDADLTAFAQTNAGSSTLGIAITVYRTKPLTLSAQTIYYLNLKSGLTASTIYCRGDNSATRIFAENAYL